jgi:RNA polymerase sigma factor (sigma-70 family)
VNPRANPARLASRKLLACQTDDRLVALTRAGNERAFEAIVDRYSAPLLRHASRLLPASRAEDAVQQAFSNAYDALQRSDAAIDLKPWLYRIAHNASLNLLRQNGWDYEQIPADFDGVMRPDQAVELGERLKITISAVKALPPRQRDAIVLRELEGRSYDEIATALGTGDGAVRQLLNRARSGLRAGVTAVTPWPLLLRMPMGPTTGGAERVIEFAGAAGLAKVSATALVAAAVVGGSVAGPVSLPGIDRSKPNSSEAVAAAPAKKKNSESTRPTSAGAAQSGSSGSKAGRKDAVARAKAKRNRSAVRRARERAGHGESGDKRSGDQLDDETPQKGSSRDDNSTDDPKAPAGAGTEEADSETDSVASEPDDVKQDKNASDNETDVTETHSSGKDEHEVEPVELPESKAGDELDR